MSAFIRLLRAFRHLGVQRTVQSILYAAQRDLIDRRFLFERRRRTWIEAGRLLTARPSTSQGAFEFENMSLAVELLGDDLIHLKWTPGDAYPGYAAASYHPDPVAAVWRQHNSIWELKGTQIGARLDSDGSLQILDRAGRLIRHDRAPRRGRGWSLETELDPQERIYGLGERSSGPNLRPGSYELWNTDPPWSYGPGDDPLYLNIPAMLHIRPGSSHMVFFENPFRGQVTLADTCQVQFNGGQLDYYVIVGTPSECLARFIELVGRPPMPPRWALGFHQSRWGYQREHEIRAVAQGFRERQLPLAAIHLDIDYMDGYRVFSVDESDFPDLRRLSQDIHSHAVRLVTILDPGIKWDSNYSIFKDGLAQDVYCKTPGGRALRGVVWPGWVVYPDFTSSRARTWWGKHYQGLVDQGISGFWHDMNEPASFAAWGPATLPLGTRHDLDGLTGDHRQAHNLYALQMNRAGYEALRRTAPDRRPWILSRSGWTGNQRYAWNWTGDTQSTWAALKMTVATVIGLSLSGIYFSGPDAGGFQGDPSPELFTRWFQLSCMLPFFRVHSSIDSPPREPWRFDRETQAVLEKFLHLRAQLIPYLYTLAARAAHHGEPLVRPVFWPDGRDPDLLDVQDAYLLGDHLLVAPILEKGARSRSLRLPDGDWYDFWSGQVHHGGQDIHVEAPLDQIPIFVRGGCVLPLGSQSALVLRVFPQLRQESTFSHLYLDSGDGYGASRWDLFSLERVPEGLHLAHSAEGSYRPPQMKFSLEVVGTPGQQSDLYGSASRIATVNLDFRTSVVQVNS